MWTWPAARKCRVAVKYDETAVEAELQERLRAIAGHLEGRGKDARAKELRRRNPCPFRTRRRGPARK